jgi:hypothetical protein
MLFWGPCQSGFSGAVDFFMGLKKSIGEICHRSLYFCENVIPFLLLVLRFLKNSSTLSISAVSVFTMGCFVGHSPLGQPSIRRALSEITVEPRTDVKLTTQGSQAKALARIAPNCGTIRPTRRTSGDLWAI